MEQVQVILTGAKNGIESLEKENKEAIKAAKMVEKNLTSMITKTDTSQQKIAENVTINTDLITKLQNRIDKVEKDTMEKTQTPEHVQVSLTEAKNNIRSLEQKVAKTINNNTKLKTRMQDLGEK